MAHVFLGLGSNIERERYVVAGLDALQRLFGEFEHSSVYDSAAIGFDGQAFLNLVVAVETDLSVAVLARQLRQIEVEHGRPANATRFSARQLDIDVLTYVPQRLGVVVDGCRLLFQTPKAWVSFDDGTRRCKNRSRCNRRSRRCRGAPRNFGPRFSWHTPAFRTRVRHVVAATTRHRSRGAIQFLIIRGFIRSNKQ